ncbi:hypothetical protein ACWD4G_30040 [Streptomyces sp. NPDC002643]
MSTTENERGMGGGRDETPPGGTGTDGGAGTPDTSGPDGHGGPDANNGRGNDGDPRTSGTDHDGNPDFSGPHSGEPEDSEPAPGGADGGAVEGATDAARDRRRLSTPATTVLGLFLLVDVVFVVGALVTLWPVVLATVEPGAEPTAAARWSPFGLGGWALTADTAMLLAVVVCSALGSFVHAATSFATYVGNRRLYASWLWWYLMRAGIGVALALLVYLLLRGGLFAGSSGAGATNPYGFSGIAGLCGLFSKQATDKLREICDTILSTTGDGDRDRRDGLSTARGGNPDRGRS